METPSHNNLGGGTASAGQSATPLVTDGAVKNAVNALTAPADLLSPGVPVPACSGNSGENCRADKAGARGDTVGRGLQAGQSVSPLVWPSERPGTAYVRLSAVSAACGIGQECLHNNHRPYAWGVPRDWVFSRGITAYRLDSLPDLVRELSSNGQSEAAKGLACLIAELRGAPPPKPAHLIAGWSGKVDRRPPLEKRKPWYREGQYS